MREVGQCGAYAQHPDGGQRTFYFYGSKRRAATTYPPPSHDTIIEPFAGAAAYSMFHLGAVKRVLLIDKDERVVDTWQRVLAMTPDQLLAYPVPAVGDKTQDFLIMTAATSGATGRLRTLTVTDRVREVLPGMLRQMAAVLPLAQQRIEVRHGDYRDAPDVDATWFVDPPYSVTSLRPNSPLQQGNGYAKGCDAGSLDYATLGDWCRTRRGQKIVCEQDGAGWLPFRHSGRARNADAQGQATGELVWVDPEWQLQLL